MESIFSFHRDAQQKKSRKFFQDLTQKLLLEQKAWLLLQTNLKNLQA